MMNLSTSLSSAPNPDHEAESGQMNAIPYPYKEGTPQYDKQLQIYKDFNKPTLYETPEEEWYERECKEKKICSKCHQNLFLY